MSLTKLKEELKQIRNSIAISMRNSSIKITEENTNKLNDIINQCGEYQMKYGYDKKKPRARYFDYVEFKEDLRLSNLDVHLKILESLDNINDCKLIKKLYFYFQNLKVELD